MPLSLANILLKVAGMEKRDKQAYRPRPSSAGPERCIRQLTYHASGIKEDKGMPDRFIMVLDDSSFHADLVGDWINKMAGFFLHSQEMKVEIVADGMTLGGSIDGILTDLLHKDYLLEIKALNHFSFERYWKGVWPLDYITQTVLYLGGLQSINPEIDKALLLVKNKNTSQLIDFLIHYDNKKDIASVESVTHSNGEFRIGKPAGERGKTEPLLIIENIISNAIKKFKLVDEHVKNGTLPDRPFELGTTFPCGYCGWEPTCFAGYEKEYEQLETDAVLDSDVEDLCRLYLENDMHQKEMKKECDEQKQQIKNILKEKGVSKGRAGCYTLNNSLQYRTKIDKELIPTDILKMATIKYPLEMFTIRKPKLKLKKGKQ